METDGKKIDEFSPSLQFTVLLYLYFVVLLTLGASSLMHLISYGHNYFIINSNIPKWAVIWDGAISTLNILYGLKSITLALRGHRCAVSAMRWSLWLCFFYTTCEYLGRIGPAGMGFVLIVPLIPILFSLFFWLYMLMSKSIRNQYPKAERKKWIWGTLGKMLFWFLILKSVSVFYTRIVLEKNSQFIKPSLIQLNKGEITDGICVSHPLSSWIVQKGSKTDQLYTTVDSCRIHTGSTVMNNSDRLSFNVMLGQELLSGGITKGQEFSYLDTVLLDKKLYCSRYSIIPRDSVGQTYFMSAALFDNKSKKVAFLSMVGKTPVLIPDEDVIRYMKSVDFDLKQRIIKNNGVKDE